MATEKKKSTSSKTGASSAAVTVAATAPSKAQVDLRNPLQKRKGVVGTVVSDKMQKTIVVKVDRRVRHTMYKKYIVRSARYKAHDEKNEAKMGDRVILVESRPLSREKRWVLQSIVRRVGQVLDVNV